MKIIAPANLPPGTYVAHLTPDGETAVIKEEKPTSATPGDRSTTPYLSYGNWEPTPYLRWHVIVGSIDHRELQQKFRRRVKRDFGHGTISRSYEYEWKPIPEGM